MRYFFTLIPVLLFLLSCSSEEPAPIATEGLVDPQENAEAPMNATASQKSSFTSFAHGLTGNATLYILPSGSHTLRFENFTMTEGPDVYVFFSKSNNYSEANTVGLSMLKGHYSNASINFEVNPAIDVATHRYVLVYCVKYSSLFGYAELKY